MPWSHFNEGEAEQTSKQLTISLNTAPPNVNVVAKTISECKCATRACSFAS